MYQIMTTKLLETMPSAAETAPTDDASRNAGGTADAAASSEGKDIPEEKKMSIPNGKATAGKNATVKKVSSDSPPLSDDEQLFREVALLLPHKGMEWSGSATELIGQLTNISISPNMITRKLNASTEKLLTEYGLQYERTQSHKGRIVKLTRVAPATAGTTTRHVNLQKKDGD